MPLQAYNRSIDCKDDSQPHSQLFEGELKFTERSASKMPKFMCFPKGKIIKNNKGKIIPFKMSRLTSKDKTWNQSIGDKSFYSKREGLFNDKGFTSILSENTKKTIITPMANLTSQHYRGSREVEKRKKRSGHNSIGSQTTEFLECELDPKEGVMNATEPLVQSKFLDKL